MNILTISMIGPESIKKFAKREWRPLFMWAGSGIVAAAIIRLFYRDAPFRNYLASGYQPIRSHYEGLGTYFTFVLAAFLALAVAIAPQIPGMVSRCWRSWWYGVVSGLRIPPFICALVTFTLYSRPNLQLLYVNLGVVSSCFISGYLLYLKAQERTCSSLKEEEVQVSEADIAAVGTVPGESDEPIHNWNEDILERAPLVNTLSFSLLISKVPLIALFGELGSGKTSVLNLLRNNLKKRAIVVSFSTWLPGSAEALASYLLGDIAKECSRNYIVPGIRKDTRKLASALAKSIPTLSVFSELFSDTTQRQDIEALGEVISRLPKRVVVLLDEVDRMQKKEILALLKIVRGVSESQNLSFVYAFDREIVEKAVIGSFDANSHAYFEKFFPVSLPVPVLDVAMLQAVGIKRLVTALNRRNWFEVNADEVEFAKELGKLWGSRVAPLCRNLRAVGLFANDVGMAASPLRGEVNPIDLTFIELLRRFEPSIYEIVWRYRDTVTGGEDWLSPSYQHRSDKEKAELGKRMVEEVNKAVLDPDRHKAVRNILRGMFPRFSELDREGQGSIVPRKGDSEGDKRISDPSLISAYFRYKLPEDVFSSRKMEAFMQRFEAAPDGSKNTEFFSVFNSMQKGERRRSDFLSKLSDKVKTISQRSAEQIALVCALAADQLVYDLMFVSIGEAGHALRILIRVASRLSDVGDRTAFLAKCMAEATDDTLAFRIQTALSKPGQDFDLGISFGQLYPSFVRRMRYRYGRDVDAQTIDLTYSDHHAFNLWGMSNLSKEGISADPEDRAIQRDFWLRYIGNSKSRLAFAFANFIMPNTLYEQDPTPFVENKIPVADLGELYNRVRDEPDLPEVEQASIRRLARFLDGEFKNGLSISQFEGRDN